MPDHDRSYYQKQYNYSLFDLEEEMKPFADFGSAPNAGTQAPSFQLEELATGDMISMKDLWKKNLVIVEFGSFT